MLKTADQAIVSDSNLPDGSPTDDAVRRAVDEGIRLFNNRDALGARRMLESAVKLDRKSLIAWLNFGVACDALGDFDAARSAFRTAAGLHPDSAEAQHGLGLVAARTGDFERAELYFRNAIRLNPIAGYYNNLSILLRSLGRSKEADESLRRAVELSPGDATMHSNLLLGLFYTHGGDGALMRAEHDTWARRHADHLVERSPFDFTGRDLSPDRRLRVGYLSPDFRLHSVAFFFEPLLAAHDRTAVEVFCYSDARVPDEVTRRIRGQAGVWRESHTLDDDALARRIMDDAIDILVDLAGHTGDHRLTVVARRVAPVQVSYLGYPGTTGLKTMDYRLTDAIADPAGAEALYSETLVRLPRGMLCYSGDRHAASVATPPSQASGRVTFGTFNQLHKVTDRMLHSWSRILERVPGSRLCMKAFGLADEGNREEFRRRFVAHGGDAARLALLSSDQSVASHLARYNNIDIALDTFPYNGVTTTFEALWMGVPVVTLAGETHVTRMGATILSHVGLEELVARDEEEYVDKAVALARAPDRLADLRCSLRARVETSPLCNAERLARAIETAYREMWRAIVSSSRSPDESVGRTQSN